MSKKKKNTNAKKPFVILVGVPEKLVRQFKAEVGDKWNSMHSANVSFACELLRKSPSTAAIICGSEIRFEPEMRELFMASPKTALFAFITQKSLLELTAELCSRFPETSQTFLESTASMSQLIQWLSQKLD